MGLFDKIKSIKSFISGNAAKVELLMDASVKRGKPFKITVTAEVKENNIEMKRVYFRLLSTEKVIVTRTVQDGGNISIKEEEKKNTLNDVYFDVIASGTLHANEKYTWEKEITLPEHLQPTFNAYPRTHVWQVIAGIDMKGNDPDSGWKDLFVE